MEERDNLSLEEAFAALLQLIEDKRSEIHQQIQLLNDMGDYRQLPRYAPMPSRSEATKRR